MAATGAPSYLASGLLNRIRELHVGIDKYQLGFDFVEAFGFYEQR
jgi:hypothetical protein